MEPALRWRLVSDIATCWEHFAHSADVGVRGRGPSLESAFEQAALALAAVVCDPAKVAAHQALRVHCESSDPELLLVEWLDALIYAMDTRHLLFRQFDVHIDDGRLDGVARGEPLDVARHQPAVEVKGATFTELRVAHEADGRWVAQCVVDV